MADCRLRFDFSGSNRALVDKIRTKVTAAGGSFDGADAAGSFVLPTPIGAFEGDYLIEQQTIWIEVTRKPFFVPCSAIEAKLAEYVRAR